MGGGFICCWISSMALAKVKFIDRVQIDCYKIDTWYSLFIFDVGCLIFGKFFCPSMNPVDGIDKVQVLKSFFFFQVFQPLP
jgi:hypothetical protein